MNMIMKMGKINFKDYKLFWWGFGVFINDLIYMFF